MSRKAFNLSALKQRAAWLALALPGRVLTLLLAIAFGLALPVMGASLLLFVIIDWLRWRNTVVQRVSQAAE